MLHMDHASTALSPLGHICAQYCSRVGERSGVLVINWYSPAPLLSRMGLPVKAKHCEPACMRHLRRGKAYDLHPTVMPGADIRFLVT